MAIPRSDLSAAPQAFALRAQFPEVQGELKAGRLVWTGELQPTPLSRSYRVQIAYGPRGQPKVRVLEEFATYEEHSLPHVYSDGTLCLHEWHEWTATMSIADTIVPWTAEWLVHYEIWLMTGEWYGARRLAAAAYRDDGTADGGGQGAAGLTGYPVGTTRLRRRRSDQEGVSLAKLGAP